MPKEKNQQFLLPECMKKPTADMPAAAPTTNPGPSTRTTRKRKAKSAPRPAKRRSLSPERTDAPLAAGLDEPEQATAEKASVSNGPKETLASQVGPELTKARKLKEKTFLTLSLL